jgi:hypothetical protein
MNDSTREMSPLRQRMLDDMRLRKLAPKTQEAYARCLAAGEVFTPSARYRHGGGSA